MKVISEPCLRNLFATRCIAMTNAQVPGEVSLNYAWECGRYIFSTCQWYSLVFLTDASRHSISKTRWRNDMEKLPVLVAIWVENTCQKGHKFSAVMLCLILAWIDVGIQASTWRNETLERSYDVNWMGRFHCYWLICSPKWQLLTHRGLR